MTLVFSIVDIFYKLWNILWHRIVCNVLKLCENSYLNLISIKRKTEKYVTANLL